VVSSEEKGERRGKREKGRLKMSGLWRRGSSRHWRRRGPRTLPSVEEVALRGIDRDGGGRRLCREAKNWRAQK
jgi:hypothetical protein